MFVFGKLKYACESKHCVMHIVTGHRGVILSRHTFINLIPYNKMSPRISLSPALMKHGFHRLSLNSALSDTNKTLLTQGSLFFWLMYLDELFFFKWWANINVLSLHEAPTHWSRTSDSRHALVWRQEYFIFWNTSRHLPPSPKLVSQATLAENSRFIIFHTQLSFIRSFR